MELFVKRDGSPGIGERAGHVVPGETDQASRQERPFHVARGSPRNPREERVRRAEALLPAALLVVAKREAPRANWRLARSPKRSPPRAPSSAASCDS